MRTAMGLHLRDQSRSGVEFYTQVKTAYIAAGTP